MSTAALLKMVSVIFAVLDVPLWALSTVVKLLWKFLTLIFAINIFLTLIFAVLLPFWNKLTTWSYDLCPCYIISKSLREWAAWSMLHWYLYTSTHVPNFNFWVRLVSEIWRKSQNKRWGPVIPLMPLASIINNDIDIHNDWSHRRWDIYRGTERKNYSRFNIQQNTY